jgi:hypothetical protein
VASQDVNMAKQPPRGLLLVSINTICALPASGGAGAGWPLFVETSNLILSSPQASGRILFAQPCTAMSSDEQRSSATSLGFMATILSRSPSSVNPFAPASQEALPYIGFNQAGQCAAVLEARLRLRNGAVEGHPPR